MYFIFTIELNLLLSCFGLSALYTRIDRNSWPSPPAQHSSSTAGVSKIQFEGRRAAPLLFSLLAVLILCLSDLKSICEKPVFMRCLIRAELCLKSRSICWAWLKAKIYCTMYMYVCVELKKYSLFAEIGFNSSHRTSGKRFKVEI